MNRRFPRSAVIPAALLALSLPALAAAQPEAVFAPCTPSTTTLCLNAGRFSVTATWKKTDGSTGPGYAVLLTGDTGYFWFFDPANVEVATKVLDACGYNSRYWVFASGLTNVGVTLDYLDTATGSHQTYQNPVGTPFQPIQATDAFATCSTPTTRIADVNGTWAAALTLDGLLYPATLTLFQNGASVTGAASVSGGGGGTLTGTVNGQTLQFTVNEVSPCQGTYSGSATLTSTSLAATGTLHGTDCNGPYTGSLDGAKTFVGGPSKGSAAIAGLWDATLTFDHTQRSAVVAFVQDGNSVSGTAVITGMGSGSLTGSVIGNQLRFTVNELSPCLGLFVGEATVTSAGAMTGGTILGSDCGGSYEGTFSGEKR